MLLVESKRQRNKDRLKLLGLGSGLNQHKVVTPKTKKKKNPPKNRDPVPRRNMPTRAARDTSSNHANSAASAESRGTTTNEEKY